jgi:type IV pilus assembly protein PilW
MRRRALQATGMRGRRQRGFTLVELMVTVAIALFLLFGLGTIVQNVKATSANQALLAQLQDGERLAMIMMTDVTQEAGYFPNPVNNSSASLVATGPFAGGQAIYGTHINGANPDTLQVRYLTASGDGILTCHGTSNTTGGTVLYTNTFSVDPVQGLMCDDGSGALALVSGVTNLQVVYGVKRNLGLPGNDVDTYLNASQMAAADWLNVTAVTITLTFANPLAAAASSSTNEGVSQPTTVSFTRVVDIMNRVGQT